MRPIGWIIFLILMALGGAGYFIFSNIEFSTDENKINTQSSIYIEDKLDLEQQTMPLSITSPSFDNNGAIPELFTCDGKNISPELLFLNTPKETKSFALTMEDPDVPLTIRADGMWDHWIIWNIPPTTLRIGEGEIPEGSTGTGTNGKASYLGPCPPDREHRYIFTLYALDSVLDIPSGARKEQLLNALAPHIIEKAQLVGRYNRN